MLVFRSTKWWLKRLKCIPWCCFTACMSAITAVNPWLQSALKTSCKNIQAADANAPSGEYYISTAGSPSKTVKVYCEMGLHGGGYTFLHPTALTELTDADVQSIFTDRKSFLMRYRESNGRQSYSVLEQLRAYRLNIMFCYCNNDNDNDNDINNSHYCFNSIIFLHFYCKSSSSLS